MDVAIIEYTGTRIREFMNVTGAGVQDSQKLEYADGEHQIQLSREDMVLFVC